MECTTPEATNGATDADKTAARLIRLPRVLEISALTIPTLYRKMERREFPLPVAVGPNTRAWVLAEVAAWVAARIGARDTGADADLRAVNPNIGKGRRNRRSVPQRAT